MKLSREKLHDVKDKYPQSIWKIPKNEGMGKIAFGDDSVDYDL